MLDRLRSMEVFVAAANTGSFAAAAVQLGMSAQMVARHVLALEDRLQVRLINRTTRKQSLTEIGQRYLVRCRDALAAFDAADVYEQPHGRLRISAPHQFGSHSLMAFVGEFMQRYPNIEIDLSLTDRAVNIIEEGFEAVVRIGDLGIGDSSSLVARPLGGYQMLTCAAPDYLRDHGVPTHPSDLYRHQCLGYVFWDRVVYDEWLFTRDDELFKIRVGGRLQVNDAVAQLNAARSGLGILLGAEDLVEKSLESGELIQVLPEYQAPYKLVHLIYPVEKQRSVKLQRFVDEAVERFGSRAPR
ncbi:LysR family transcriptional regulator [Pseudomonas putida]|uniref:LysR family transcriptional regulator n=1 Tax=Pseudomonas putida group TaxID=136845 RepID=UPI003209AA43